jgi:hypothetical protein
MALDPKVLENPEKLQELINAAVEAGMQSLHRKNINYDVHMGLAAQAPFSGLEDMAAPLQRYATYEEMAQAEAEAAKRDGTEPTMEKRRDGSWVRYIERHTGGEPVVKDGQLYHVKERVARPVALSVADAKQRRADTFDGDSWIRNGEKREKERFAALRRPRNKDRFLELATPEETAVVRRANLRMSQVALSPAQADDSLPVKGEDKSKASSAKKEG